MTDIFINGKKIDYSLEKENTIGEILGAIESECEKTGMTITSIKVDGKIVPASGLDDLFKADPASIASVELITISGQDVLVMMRELGSNFTGWVTNLKDIPIHLQTGKDLAVMETINGFSTHLQELYRVLPLLPLTGLPEGELKIDDTPLEELPGVLAPLLEELLNALKIHDTVLVGDLSEYELAPRIEKLGIALCAV